MSYNDTKEDAFQLTFSQYLAGGEDGDFRAKDESIYEWKGTHWQMLDDKEAQKLALKYLELRAPQHCTQRKSADCVDTAALYLPDLPTIKTGKIAIPVRNGTVELDEDYIPFLRHSDKEDGLTYCLTCEYDEYAEYNKLNKYLNEALPSSKVRDYLREYCGATLLNDTRFQKVLTALGKGGSGKSTIAETISALHRDVFPLMLDNLEGFMLDGLQGASLFVVDEMPTRINEQMFKIIVSGGLIQVDRKHRKSLRVRNSCMGFVSANIYASITDQSTGYWRRQVIIPFNNPPKVVELDLAKKIIESELSGVLNYCLAGLLTLLKRGKLLEGADLPTEMQEALIDAKQASNSVDAWILDAGITAEADVWRTRGEVHYAYKSWCEMAASKPVGPSKLFERLETSLDGFVEDRKMVKGKRGMLVNVNIPDYKDSKEN
jgi:putative DNA primase/helicase